jgi:hypothetical protein
VTTVYDLDLTLDITMGLDGWEVKTGRIGFGGYSDQGFDTALLIALSSCPASHPSQRVSSYRVCLQQPSTLKLGHNSSSRLREKLGRVVGSGSL